MNIYIEAEKRLAELKGFTKLVERYYVGRIRLIGYDQQGEFIPVPMWTRDWAACGPLMVEHDVWPEYLPYTKTIKVQGEGITWYQAYVPDHPDKDAAVCYASVMAVIAKLEAQRVHQA